MQPFNQWISKHKNLALLVVFILIALPPIALYFTAQSKSWSLALLTIIVLGNLLIMFIR